MAMAANKFHSKDVMLTLKTLTVKTWNIDNILREILILLACEQKWLDVAKKLGYNFYLRSVL